jgi:hypothetical protein
MTRCWRIWSAQSPRKKAYTRGGCGIPFLRKVRAGMGHPLCCLCLRGQRPAARHLGGVDGQGRPSLHRTLCERLTHWKTGRQAGGVE